MVRGTGEPDGTLGKVLNVFMRRFFAVLFVILLAACAMNTFATAKLLKSDDSTGIELIRGGCKPVIVRPGSMFFETESERTVLHFPATGAATEYNSSDSSAEKAQFEATWTEEDGRRVSIAVERIATGYTIKLSANPDDDITRWGLSIAAEEDEYFTGALERVVDGKQHESWKEGIDVGMDLHGQMVEMIVKPTVALYAPFYISENDYGVFVKGTWPGVFDFCRYDHKSVLIQFEGPSLEMDIYQSNKPAEIIKAHALSTGPSVLPPKWAFSHWRWRDNHDNEPKFFDGTPANVPYNSQVVEDVLMMKALDIPMGVYWLDRPWAIGSMGYDDFEWNTNRFPNPQDMVKWLNNQDIELLIWIAPWVMGDMHKEAREKGYALSGQRKHNDNRTLVDFTNPDAVAWWQEGLKRILKDGVKGFKLDRSEEIVPNDREHKAFDGRTSRELHNDYPHLYVKETYEAAKEVHGTDFVLLPRAAYTGSARYAAFWAGDTMGTEWGLRSVIIGGQRSAVMGYPLWGSDTGGYWGKMDPEVCARWVAFSAFCPIMEVGPTNDRAFWDMPQEPSYNEELIAIWRTYAKLHTTLIDYSYKHAKEAHETGMPIMRPLFLVDQSEDAYSDWETYLYGSDILVSPIWKKGQTSKTLYLPAGNTWIDAWNISKTYKGGQKITVEAPLHKIPIFIRTGSNVELGDIETLYQESLEKAKSRPSMQELQNAMLQ